VTVLTLVAIAFGLIFTQATSQINLGQNTIIIGSKNFTEQVILGEIIAQQIETKTDLKVDRRFNLGGTFICHNAVKAGQIDGYVEYTGTALTTIIKQKPITDPQIVYEKVKASYEQEFNLTVMPSLGFENTFALVIRSEDAEKFNIKTLSEAAQYISQWRAGFGYEFITREDGYPGLAKAYGFQFTQPPQEMELGLIYQALANKKVDIVAGNSTDGLISVFNLFILEDDKKYFPPYEAVPIFNQNTLTKYPQLKDAIAQLTGKITAKEMQQMNYQVDDRSVPVKQVVAEFLSAKWSIK
jgi:osmoprotectant transport system permease protein